MNKYSDLLIRNKIREAGKTRESSRGILPGSGKSSEISPLSIPRSYFHHLSPGISAISMEENLKFSRNYSKKADLPQEISLKLPNVTRSPSEKDFCSLLSKLDEISMPKVYIREVVIKEEENKEFQLNEGVYQCFKIFTKGKKCPLSFKIQIFFGNIMKYLSITDKYPGIAGDFYVYKGETSEIYDKSQLFTCKFVYLGIKSITNSSFQIFASFSNRKCQKRLTKIGPVLSDESFLEEKTLKSKSPEKNYIQENMINLLNFPKISSEKSLKGQNWSNKREKVLVRKNLILKEKKQKTIELLSRRIKKLEIEAIENENREKHYESVKICDEFLGLMILFFSARALRRKMFEKKTEIVKDRILKQKVVRIQRFYKARKGTSKDVDFGAVLTESLLLYRKCAFKFLLRETKGFLLNLIKNSAKTTELSRKISFYVDSTRKIQRMFRSYKQKKQKRIDLLKAQWKRCVKKALFSKKNKKVRSKNASKFFSVLSTTRDAILEEFYSKALTEFKKAIKKYVFSLQPHNLQILKPFVPPKFLCTLTDLQMDELIKNCISRSQ